MNAIANSQDVLGYQDYFPFGKIMPGRSYTSGNLYDNYKFTGRACPDSFGERDDEFDLTLDYMQARMYDPVIGRFLSVDPLADLYPAWSPYTYVLNNPSLLIDPTGMCPEKEDIDCVDDTDYGEGAIVENKYGSWEYLGNGEWKTLSTSSSGSDALGSFIAFGIQFSDAVADAGAQMTVITGGLTAASLKRPILVDTKVLAGLTALSAYITMGADATATGLSAVDAYLLDGDFDEFVARFNASGIGLIVTGGSGYLYRKQLRNSLLNKVGSRCL